MFRTTPDNLVMTTALSAIRTGLPAGIDELHWFVNAYSLSCAASMLMAAAPGDRLSPLRSEHRTVDAHRHACGARDRGRRDHAPVAHPARRIGERAEWAAHHRRPARHLRLRGARARRCGRPGAHGSGHARTGLRHHPRKRRRMRQRRDARRPGGRGAGDRCFGVAGESGIRAPEKRE